jgi:hypothetical protein
MGPALLIVADQVGLLFVIFNGFALVIHLLFMNSVLKRPDENSGPWRRVYLLGTLVLYLLFLVPYAATGSLTHGWHGIYTIGRCHQNLHILTRSLAQFIDENGETFPESAVSEDLGDLLVTEKLKEFYGGRDLFVCLAEASFMKKPRLYEWNRELSGITLDQARVRPSNTWVLSCVREHYDDRTVTLAPLILSECDKIKGAKE